MSSVLGRRYRLTVEQRDGPSKVLLPGKSRIVPSVRPGVSAVTRGRVLERWYRTQLRELAEPLVRQWEARLGAKVTTWGMKKMKTKWGSCSPATGQVWLNLELLGSVELKGMALGTDVAIGLSLLLALFDRLGWTASQSSGS